VNVLDVCAAVIRRGDSFLLATRPPNSHLAGKWEFPGGKLRPDESAADCIRREIREELGIDVEHASLLASLEHTYPERTVRLLFMTCAVAPDAAPHGREGQRCGWFTPDEMETLDLTPADREFVATLRREHASR